jgi:SAM-dependent methyltransferase
MRHDIPSPVLSADIRDGVYARKQVHSAAGMVAWSHARRFRAALALASDATGKRILDYGCGDGSFLAMLAAAGVAPREVLGVDVAQDLVEDCRKRLGGFGITFLTLPELESREPGTLDMIFCMEVLEHVPHVDEVLDRLHRLLAPGAQLVISVPVEIGLPLVVKQVARRIAGWRGIGDYPGTGTYRLSEWLPSLLAGSQQHIPRRLLENPDGSQFHDHKGFNWIAMRERLRTRFTIDRVLSSPFPWLPPHLGTQAWFVARKTT